MQTVSPAPLRVLVACVFRLAIRAFAASQDAAAPIEVDVAPSHELLQRLAAGEAADVLVLADMALADRAARADSPAVAFAVDPLMIAARPEIGLTDRNLLERLLDDRVRVSVAEPGRHATGDLALRLFDDAEALVPGAAALLRAKARQTLIPTSAGPSVWGPRRVMDVLSSGDADLVIGTRSVVRTLSAVADLVTPLPPLAEALTCGVVMLTSDPARRGQAERFIQALLDPAGRALLERHGFDAAPNAV